LDWRTGGRIAVTITIAVAPTIAPAGAAGQPTDGRSATDSELYKIASVLLVYLVMRRHGSYNAYIG
jgi:hypothetical protein